MESGGWSRGVGHVRASGRRLGNCDFFKFKLLMTRWTLSLLEIDKTFLFIVVGHARLVVELFNWIQFGWLCAMLRPSLFWSCLNDTAVLWRTIPRQFEARCQPKRCPAIDIPIYQRETPNRGLGEAGFVSHRPDT